MNSQEPCNLCGTMEEPTFPAGGVWWCRGCAEWQTKISAGIDEEPDKG